MIRGSKKVVKRNTFDCMTSPAGTAVVLCLVVFFLYRFDFCIYIHKYHTRRPSSLASLAGLASGPQKPIISVAATHEENYPLSMLKALQVLPGV